MERLILTSIASDKLRKAWMEAQWRHNGPKRKDSNSGDRIRVNKYGFSELSSGMSMENSGILFEEIQKHVNLQKNLKGVANHNITPDSKQFYTQGDKFWMNWFKPIPKGGLANDKPDNIRKFTRFEEPIVLAHSIQRLCQGFACNLENYETFKAMGFDVHHPVKDGKPVRHRYFAGGVCFHHLLAKVTRQHKPKANANGQMEPYQGPLEIELFYVNSDHLDMFIRGNTRKNGFDMTPDRDVFPQRWLTQRKDLVLRSVKGKGRSGGRHKATNFKKGKNKKPNHSGKNKTRSRTEFKRKKEVSVDTHRDAFTVRQLRDMCKQHGLKVSGKKDELIVRLDKAGKL